MAHSKCLRCRVRVWRQSPADLCPGCGGDLLPVEALSELIGLRSLGTPKPSHTGSDTRFEQISKQIRDAVAHQDAERARRAGGDQSPDP
jgi:hypothetical protein